jgi:type IV secretion system protein VirB2
MGPASSLFRVNLRQALWVLVGIAGVAAAPTIVAAVFGGS